MAPLFPGTFEFTISLVPDDQLPSSEAVSGVDIADRTVEALEVVVLDEIVEPVFRFLA